MLIISVGDIKGQTLLTETDPERGDFCSSSLTVVQTGFNKASKPACCHACLRRTNSASVTSQICYLTLQRAAVSVAILTPDSKMDKAVFNQASNAVSISPISFGNLRLLLCFLTGSLTLSKKTFTMFPQVVLNITEKSKVWCVSDTESPALHLFIL